MGGGKEEKEERTRARGNRHQPSDHSRTEPDRRPLPLQPIIQQTPRHTPHRRRQVGHDPGHDRPQIPCQRAARVEPEPAHPHKHGPDHDVAHVVRPVVQLLRAVAPPLAQHHRVRQRGRAARHVHRRAAREVQHAHALRPAARVPRPARDRVVHDRGPDEHEDDAGEHAPALGHGARRERDGHAREHALVDGK